ncbi:MAG: hypothetical protein MRJ65_08225 [Candidatus Brocadiaceae bacterium]|nr:hypothetical protein [Candidatus Brocadiaceae bacterium]
MASVSALVTAIIGVGVAVGGRCRCYIIIRVQYLLVAQGLIVNAHLVNAPPPAARIGICPRTQPQVGSSLIRNCRRNHSLHLSNHHPVYIDPHVLRWPEYTHMRPFVEVICKEIVEVRICSIPRTIKKYKLDPVY